MGGLQGPDGMRMEGTGYLFDFEGWGITSGEEGLSEVGGVGVEVIRVTLNLPTAKTCFAAHQEIQCCHSSDFLKLLLHYLIPEKVIMYLETVINLSVTFYSWCCHSALK